MEDDAADRPWSRNWPLVSAAFFCFGVSITHSYIMGPFIGPIEREMHWSRSEISSGLLMNSIVAGIGAPFIGWLIDLLGPRRIALPGMALYCAGIALLGFTRPTMLSWWSLWLIVALGALLIKPTVWTAAVVKPFGMRSGLALSVVLSGGGAAGIVLPPLADWLISLYGWRTAFQMIGVGSALFALPILFLFFTDTVRAEPRVRAERPALAVPTIRKTLVNLNFLRFVVVAFAMVASIQGIKIHFIPILTGFAISSHSAAAIVSLIGVGTIVGRLATGWMLDRWNATYVGAAMMLLPALGSGMLLVDHAITVTHAMIAALTFGLSLGGEVSVIAYLVARYFSMSRFGLVFGCISSVLAIAAGVGPVIAGAVYDQWATYLPFLWGAIAAFALSALLIGTLGPYPESASPPKPS